MNLLKKINWIYLFVFLIPIFSLYIINLYGYLNSREYINRSVYIFFWIVSGLVLMKKRCSNFIINSYAIFVFYLLFNMLFRANECSNAYILCIVLPLVTLFVSTNIKITGQTLLAIGYVSALMCNCLAFIYIQLNQNISIFQALSHEEQVESFNSIYFILIAMPYIFFIKQKKYVIVFILLPLYAIILSEKTTCFLCSLCILFYYFYSEIKRIDIRYRILFLIFLILAFLCISVPDSFSLLSVKEDFESGGNGRSDIALKTLNIFLDADIIYFLFGFGPNGVTSAIGIGAHNDFLEILFDYGICGLFFFLLFIWSLIRYYIHMRNRCLVNDVYVISLIVFFIVSSASSLFATQLQILLFMVIWGIIFNVNKYILS